MPSSNEKFTTQRTIINLCSNEYTRGLYYYPFPVKLYKCVGSCNTYNDLSNKVCVPKKTEDLEDFVTEDFVFNIIKWINDSKALKKFISCKFQYKFDDRKRNPNQKWNDNKCRCECKKHHPYEKDYSINPATYNCKNSKYLASIIDSSVIMCDEIIDVEAKPYDEGTKIVTSFNKKNAIGKTQNFYILLAFLWISTVLLIPVSIYCHVIKYHVKPKKKNYCHVL